MSGEARVLVAGVGNVFLGDDGFGVEVARRLAEVPLPAGVEVADFGIRSVHLAYQLLEGYQTLVLVDAVALEGAPGTLFVIEPDAARLPSTLDAHGFDPTSVLELARSLGQRLPRVLLVGCVPAQLEEGIGLSPAVEDAVPRAVKIVQNLFAQSLAEEAPWSHGSF